MPEAVIFAAIPCLLFIPVFYYSLNTPFALVDDYGDLWTVRIFDSPGAFFGWVNEQFLNFDLERYKPFWEFYNAVAWRTFGPTPWLHHLARWVVHFGSVFAFAAAFVCISRDSRQRHSRPNGDSSSTETTSWSGLRNRLVYLLPLAVLVYLWLFFPNQPAARLSPVELYTVFFLGLSTWMMALMLLRTGRKDDLWSAMLIYGAFYAGFIGLVWSKEVNVAVALWLLVSYFALLLIEAARREGHGNQGQKRSFVGAAHILKRVDRWKFLGGLLLVLVFLHTLYRLRVASDNGGSYYVPDVTPGLIWENARWISGQLFQVETSLLITAGLVLLSASLLLFIVRKAVKGRFSNEFIFALFLLGLFASMCLTISFSWLQVLRYWYMLIPVFTTLLAFSAKFALEFAGEERLTQWRLGRWRPRPLAAIGLASFITFFIAVNYYNFLFQTVAQHSIRHTEADLLADVTSLYDQGHYVHVHYEGAVEPTLYLVRYYGYSGFLSRFYGREYEAHYTPPEEAGRPYYTVKLVREQDDLPNEYRLLSYAETVAGVLQGGNPYRVKDTGVHMPIWHVYNHDLTQFRRNGVDVLARIEEAGEPAAHDHFVVYLDERALYYVKDPCAPADAEATVFLHLIPDDEKDLSSWSQHGFNNLDFDFATYGAIGGGKCIAVRQLPAYPIKRIRTGQYVPGEGRLWEAEFTPRR